MKVIELREYKIKQGKTEEWINWMREEIIPYQKSKVMKIMSTHIHRGTDNADYFIWLREFDNEVSRKEISALTYNEWWINEIRPKIFELIDESSIKVRLLTEINL